MGWLGKILGGTLGFALGGPLGAIAGAVFGHTFDVGSELPYRDQRRSLSYNEQAQLTFFVAAFSMLAKLVQVDGRVREEELQSIKGFMQQDLKLSPESRDFAIRVFHTAMNSQASFQEFATQFHAQFAHQPRLLELMIDVLLRVSVADGTLSESEEKLILSAVRIFNFGEHKYRELRSRYVKSTDKYYVVLGVERSASEEQIKKHYRKLVLEYHPDKVASKGLPEEFVKFAHDKFREIQEAYEFVKDERGIH